MHIKNRILIFILGCFSFSILGGYLINAKIEAGGLVFIISPFLFSLILNISNRKENRFSFLKFNFKGNIKWYFLSILLYPVALIFIISIGRLIHFTTLNFEKSTLLFHTILIEFIPRMIFAFFEEMGWRGFLELEFKRKGVHAIKRHFYIGIIWALWHLPFIFATAYTTIPYAIFIPTFILGVIILSFIYGYLLQKTNSIWAGVFFHGISNTLAWSIISSKFAVFSNPLLVNISPESVLGLLIFGSIAFIFFKKNKQLDSFVTIG